MSWLRGIAYHPSIAGDIDRDWLDQHIPDRPVRVQHRGGRLWVLNSLALRELHVCPEDAPPGLEHAEARATGRLYEEDHWLRSRLHSQPPNLSKASALLARYGVTGITDTTPANGVDAWAHFKKSQENGELLQRVRMMGTAEIAQCGETPRLTHGELKIHLLESQLPELGSLCRTIESAHRDDRSIAIHCVTLTELVFALHALEAAGVLTGDRIEHASVCPDEQLQDIDRLGLRVVTQPHFIAERGDQYRIDVDTREQPWLYRAASFLRGGIPLAGGSDAPFGGANPWKSMHCATARQTATGEVMGRSETLTPEQALELYLSPQDRPGLTTSRLHVGARADLCLLQEPWERVRTNLGDAQVRCTWRDGEMIYGSV
ncbi:MAG: putative amidohydrolase YtcJ [Halieaceae bacterium]|jgi:predicted amidohydrolase YtcJ